MYTKEDAKADGIADYKADLHEKITAKKVEGSKATSTFPPMVRKIYDIMGQGNVVHHEPTANNPLGQSQLHSLIDDILDIAYSAPNERKACQDLFEYFKNGEI